MLFNSIEFAVFLPIVFLLYWYVFERPLRLQNLLLIAAGVVFYGWWDWRFLGLLLFTSGVDYLVARGLMRVERPARRKLLLGLSLAANLGLLGFFKYYNFFAEGFHRAFTFLGHAPDLHTLHIVLPVGISFYTFQSLSYTIDVYRRDLEATRDPITFFAFVGFFSQLLAGPIERARHMVPQFERPRTFRTDLARDGLRQILWGLFKKVVIADNCSFYPDLVFGDPAAYGGSAHLLATVIFAFQIYCDFSGYSDMALGIAKLFGFELMRNFAYPYFSRSVAEFWQRWHISLNTWFRDYLYIPLGGSRGGRWAVARNTFIIFAVSGLWHGAAWHFVVWGVVSALFFLPLVFFGDRKRYVRPPAEWRWLPSLREAGGMAFTFMLVCIAWVFFRATSLDHALLAFDRMASDSLFSLPPLERPKSLKIFVLGTAIMLVLEWMNRGREHGLQLDGRWSRPLRLALYYGLVALIVLYAPSDGGDFIYFQF
ncbi:MAG: MBOAT family protein [Bacteroidetes bacterium]|nr:MBOAT family protein [Bacteroidota bacterium]